MSFDMSNDDDDDSAYQAPVNFLEDNRYNPAHCLEASDSTDDTNTRLHNALRTLDERSYDILSKRWLAEDKATLHDLAAEYGVSAERIRQLEKNAMNKVKALIAS